MWNRGARINDLDLGHHHNHRVRSSTTLRGTDGDSILHYIQVEANRDGTEVLRRHHSRSRSASTLGEGPDDDPEGHGHHHHHHYGPDTDHTLDPKSRMKLMSMLLRSRAPSSRDIGKIPPDLESISCFNHSPNRPPEKIDVMGPNGIVVSKERSESWYHLYLHTTIPLLAAGTMMVIFGHLISLYQEKKLFRLDELIMVFTPLLALRANLELTLASRLCTHINMGHMVTSHQRWKYYMEDLAVAQVQAVGGGFLAGVVAIIISLIESVSDKGFLHYVSLCSCAVVTSCIAALVLGSIMMGIILSADHWDINPDNVAIPIAASFGDILTITLMMAVSILYEKMTGNIILKWIPCGLLVIAILVAIVLGYFNFKNPHTKRIMRYCWLPIVATGVICSLSGYVLKLGGHNYPIIYLYQPVVSGICANLVSVQYCRLFTFYHIHENLGTIPPAGPGATTRPCLRPTDLWQRLGTHSLGFWVFVSMIWPVHGILCVELYLSDPKVHQRHCIGDFYLLYFPSVLLQIIFMMYVMHWLVNVLWKNKTNPDTYVIPIVIALSDIFGTSILYGICGLINTHDYDCFSFQNNTSDDWFHYKYTY